MNKLNRAIALTLAIVMAAMCLTGCGESKPTLNVYNWGDYIGDDVIKMFEEEFGCKVNYSMFDQNEDMYTKVTRAKGAYDLLVPSDYMISRMIKEDLLAKIDMNNVPNISKIMPSVMGLEFDPTNEYSVPYMWGTVGIIYNKTLVKGDITAWSDLWDPQYAKQMFMMNSVRDSIAVALLTLGYDVNTRDMAKIEEAQKKLAEQKDLVLAYTGDEVKDKMIAGEAALAVVYSGDAVTMMEQNEDLDYVIPSEGTNLWVDGMVILKDSKNKELGEKFINFMCRQDIAEINRDYINYCTPQVEVFNAMDAAIRDDARIYPPADVMEKCQAYLDLGEMAKTYDDIWTKIMVN